MMPVTKSCHKLGCELSSNCAIYKAEKADLQIIPQHCGFRCDFYESKSPHGKNREASPDAGLDDAGRSCGDDLQERIMRMAGCLQ